MRITEIGAGTIGVSWTVLLAAAGHDVVVTDPRPDLADVVETGVARFGSPDLLDRVVCEPDLATAVAGADVVQEQGPEDLAVKRGIWATVAAHAPARALLLSSTSGILPSDIAAELPDDAAARLLVAHPFNPPHVLPLVELVAGQRTGRDAVGRAAAFLRGAGKEPVEIHKEVYGFVGNRLQSALFREAVSLVRDGVVSPAELDRVVTGALGPRWATGGPFLSFHLGGGDGGLRHLLEHLGPGMARRWAELGTPALDADTVEAISSATEDTYGPSREGLTTARDRAETAVLAARDDILEQS
ncbi:3-hydroxyacyl-CoA dehydrogenase NAD-binding domain-containing protein [Pseudonocardia sp. HH130629-09]|uniref:3-hydroxyacyl-CoA dehydrogenase NAD-binding domain-containing protein n=1 Tax=Pseudonocardia sp. HH130629-09 TaxID=1641402 RepID=UPI0006CB16B1|nr:3-hydroxyacyl-CoA dehydrogenase NAD-binding domain-containing protein [Pseudonocardia sp. HH130629-09]ALE83376.1 hydroxylacyl-CoA dehydrogenase [Pseudonocardia sp. HH130629-09]